jgi:hypothetical protein
MNWSDFISNTKKIFRPAMEKCHLLYLMYNINQIGLYWLTRRTPLKGNWRTPLKSLKREEPLYLRNSSRVWLLMTLFKRPGSLISLKIRLLREWERLLTKTEEKYVLVLAIVPLRPIQIFFCTKCESDHLTHKMKKNFRLFLFCRFFIQDLFRKVNFSTFFLNFKKYHKTLIFFADSDRAW